jgi:hypothetical protein
MVEKRNVSSVRRAQPGTRDSGAIQLTSTLTISINSFSPLKPLKKMTSVDVMKGDDIPQ